MILAVVLCNTDDLLRRNTRKCEHVEHALFGIPDLTTIKSFTITSGACGVGLDLFIRSRSRIQKAKYYNCARSQSTVPLSTTHLG